MTRGAILAFALVAALAIAAPIGAMSPTRLNGTVGWPAYTIFLKKGTTTVRTLKPGRYRITMWDRSNIHNFHLRGLGVNVGTESVPFMGTRTVTVTLRRGRYTYFCDAHPVRMRKTFTVK